MPLNLESESKRPLSSRLIHSVRNLLVFAIGAVLCSLPVAPALGQESSANRLKSLREQLAEVEISYGRALDSGESAAAAARVERLRQELGESIKSLIQKASSSEATLAVYRADADSTLAAIRAYEEALSDGPGQATSYWNVLSNADLVQLRDRASVRLQSLRVQLANTPREQTALSVEFRAREVEGWLKGINTEINRRGVTEYDSRLKTVRADMSTNEARLRFPQIGNTDSPTGRSAKFQNELALQVEFRLHSSPGDASLLTLRRDLPKGAPARLEGAPPRGPPDSIRVARLRLEAAQMEEISAVASRDPLRLAKARAQAAAIREWLALLKQEPTRSNKLGLSETSTEHLISIQEKWENWRDNLNLAQRSSPGANVQLAIAEADARLREIDAAIETRLLPRPPPDQADPGYALSQDQPSQPKSPELRAFERTWDRQIGHLEMGELVRLRNEFSSIPDAAIDEAATKAFGDRVVAEATALRTAYDETVQIQRHLVINSRGTQSAEAGKLLLKSRRNIQGSAQELLDFLNDPKLATTSSTERAKTLVRDFARTNSQVEEEGLTRALIDLEIVRDSADAAAQTKSLEIQAVNRTGAVPEPEFRIKLAQAPPAAQASILIKRPADYTDLYQKEKGAGTLREVMQDLRRAPGGVVVDAKLPDDLARRLDGVSVDIDTGSIKVTIDGSPRILKRPSDPVLARLAWAFVLDRRVPVIDLRPLEREEVAWLYRQYGDPRVPPTQQSQFIADLASLTSVNVNEALRDTLLVSQLILADQLMFDLLPRNSIRIEGEDIRYGLSLGELRKAFRTDMGAELNTPDWRDTLFSKSVIAISDVRYEVGSTLTIEPRFTFLLFEVSARGTSAIPLKASEAWFAAHEQELRRLPQLSRLSEFSILAALFRTVIERNTPNNLDELMAVVVPPADSPRFILQRDQISTSRWQSLRNALQGRKGEK